jgi:hypothetical protein
MNHQVWIHTLSWLVYHERDTTTDDKYPKKNALFANKMGWNEPKMDVEGRFLASGTAKVSEPTSEHDEEEEEEEEAPILALMLDGGAAPVSAIVLGWLGCCLYSPQGSPPRHATVAPKKERNGRL